MSCFCDTLSLKALFHLRLRVVTYHAGTHLYLLADDCMCTTLSSLRHLTFYEIAFVEVQIGCMQFVLLCLNHVS